MLSACRTQGTTYLRSQVLVHLRPLSDQFGMENCENRLVLVGYCSLMFVSGQWLRMLPGCVEVFQLFIQLIFKIYLPFIKLIYAVLTSSPSHLYRHLYT